LSLVVSVSLLAQDPAPSPGQSTETQEPQPVFRTGVELITIDVSATDGRGRPIEDLRAPEFVVRIDGEPRRVVSADLVRIDVEAARRQAADPFDPLFTSNQTPPNGRTFMIAVDQLHIRPGAARQVLQAASRFLERLSPLDRVAFVAFPAPGATIDFTSDFVRIRGAMESVTGDQQRFKSRFNIGLIEAIAIAQQRDFRVLDVVVPRECRTQNATALDTCEREIQQESDLMVNRLREDARVSLAALRDLLQYLAVIEGPKHLILLTEGLILNTTNDLDDVIRAATIGRTSVHALLLDVPLGDATAGVRSPTAREDRQLEVSGLEDLAAFTRGTRYNVLGTGDNIFDRIATTTSAHYLLAVEEVPGDRNGERHRVDVEVRRRGVTLHS
jgi:VWFA-related protein